ncbi:MAG: prepilin peptidase [Patescibacteria group bacterium]
MVLFALLLFVLGVCIGSFLNVLIDRLPHDESPIGGRSYCDKCKKTLKWYDMIPLLSFVFLRGKCRDCKSSISFYYLLVEFVTGIMFIAVYAYGLQTTDYGLLSISTIEQFSNGAIDYLYYLLIICSLIVVFFADIKYGIIPDAVLYPAIALSIIYHLSFIILGSSNLAMQQSGNILLNYLFSGFITCTFFLFLHIITRGKGMGFGDVKLSFLMGLFLGFPQILIALYVAFLTGAVIGLILIIWRKKKLSGGTIPFGPFLVFGALISLFFGNSILKIVLGSLSLNFL